MEETVIVIMLKDAETGFLEKELGAYSLSENSELIFNIYAEGEEDQVVMRLTCERVGALVDSIEEEDGHYDPVWVVTFPFTKEQDAMEEKLTGILNAHKEELLSVYEAIKDKEDDYRGE